MRFHKVLFIVRLILAIHVVGSCVLGACLALFLYMFAGMPPDSNFLVFVAIPSLTAPFHPRVYGILGIMPLDLLRTGSIDWIGALTFLPWLLSVVLTTILMLRPFRKQARRRRYVLKKCVECGYDLRATPEGCPECGAPRLWEAI